MGNTDILFLWQIILTAGLLLLGFYLYKTRKHYQSLTKGTDKQNLETVLGEIVRKNKETEDRLEDLIKEIEKVKKDAKFHIRKASVLRFNPFADTGGDQSFVVALLDGQNTGIVITSLHSRGVTRWYAKNVQNGKGLHHELSQEEISAIKKTGEIV